MDELLMGIGAAIIGLVILATAHEFGRWSVAADCKRDGFFWQTGVRFDCIPSKRT